MNNCDLIYKGGSIWKYAASTASTWIWAPAVMVSASIGYYYGLTGLALFCIPNFLCLILFGYVSNYIINNNKLIDTSFLQLIKTCSIKQKNIHFIIGFILTICSTIVQLIAMNILMINWFNIPTIVSCLIVSIIAVSIIWKSGIKGSIITDFYKWIVIAISAIIILISIFFNIPDINIANVKIFELSDAEYLIGFGITTTLGLITSPYVDQTMWTRAFCCEKDKIVKMFWIAGLMFIVVPICFGLVGLFSATTGIVPGWNLTNAIGHNILGIILAIAIFCTLLSTIDSNICAIQNYVCTEFNFNHNQSLFAIIIFLIICSFITNSISISLTSLFLIYGTIRTCGAMPTWLIALRKYNVNRLFVGTILALIFGAGGYIVLTLLGCNYAYICSILALLIPTIGYSKQIVR